MTAVRIALTTTGSFEEAQRIARYLVERRLAACVNIVNGVHSIYCWKGAVEEAQEYLLLIKTDAEHMVAVEAALRHLHSYEMPEFLAFAPEGGSEAYLRWIAENLDG